MPITDLQRELRQRHIGSSDSPAIIGVDPYRNAYDVWLEKTGKLIDVETAPNEAAEIGNMIEDSLLDWGAAEVGVKIIKNQRRVMDGAPLAANHDALVRARPWGFESKTTGILNPHVAREEWGAAGTDEVPERVIVQCHHQMIVSGLELVYVPALIGGRGRVLFEIRRNDELANAILDRLLHFWKLVEAGTPPPDITPHMETLKRARREPSKVTDVPEELVRRWLDARTIASAAADQEEAAKAALIAALGDAEGGEAGAAGGVTYLEHSRRSIDALMIRERYPDAAIECERVSTFRVLRHKKPKGEK
jgi:putative phage-type endonuclease